MESQGAVRRATEAALADIEPEPFREEVYAALDGASLLPGVLVVAAARAIDADATVAAVEQRAVGVQLIYDGLRLTRDLTHDPPWLDGGTDHADADVAVLVADVFVARATSLLADTEAAGAIVAVLRSFGRDQTLREEAEDPADVDRRLEADVFELAAVAGTTAVGDGIDRSVVRRAVALADSLAVEDGLPDASAALSPDLDLPDARPVEADGADPHPGRLSSLDP
jgi:hypothetical protein